MLYGFDISVVWETSEVKTKSFDLYLKVICGHLGSNEVKISIKWLIVMGIRSYVQGDPEKMIQSHISHFDKFFLKNLQKVWDHYKANYIWFLLTFISSDLTIHSRRYSGSKKRDQITTGPFYTIWIILQVNQSILNFQALSAQLCKSWTFYDNPNQYKYHLNEISHLI